MKMHEEKLMELFNLYRVQIEVKEDITYIDKIDIPTLWLLQMSMLDLRY